MFTFVAQVYAIAKTVGKVADLIDSFIDLYTQKQIEDMDLSRQNIKDERRAILQAIKQAKTDNERIALSRVLAKHNGVQDENS